MPLYAVLILPLITTWLSEHLLTTLLNVITPVSISIGTFLLVNLLYNLENTVINSTNPEEQYQVH